MEPQNKTLSKDSNIEDIEDVLNIVEKSYSIKFKPNELMGKTFGELCNIIVSKIDLTDEDSCTTQQAFYKLRTAIIEITGLKKEQVLPDTNLKFIFPRFRRRINIKRVEKQLGIKLHILWPWQPLVIFSSFLFIISLLGLFFNWRYGLVGIVTSIIFLAVGFKYGKELNNITVGDLAEKMATENYFKSRRNNTVNRKEIYKKVEYLFIDRLYLDCNEIKPETLLVRQLQ